MPPDGVSFQKEQSVTHASCEVEIPGQKETLPAILTLPPDHLKPDKVKEVGIVIGHGSNAADWQGKFLTELAGALAAQGFLVMRYFCKQKEQRRQKMYEKALDAAATSPFARSVTRWLLAGIGNGARIAAFVGTVCRGEISGFALLSYPLEEPEPLPPGKARRSLDSTPGPADSEGPLLALQAPVLLVTGDTDDLCNLPHLLKVCMDMKSVDTRLVVIKDADATLKSPQARTHTPSAVKEVCDVVIAFANALSNDTLATCSLPKPAKPASAETNNVPDTKPLQGLPIPAHQEVQQVAGAGQSPSQMHQHPVQQQHSAHEQRSVQQQRSAHEQHPGQGHLAQQHAVPQQHPMQQQHPVQLLPVQQPAVQQHPVHPQATQQHAVQQHSTQQQPMQQQPMQQQPTQQQALLSGSFSRYQNGVHFQSLNLPNQTQSSARSVPQPRTALDNVVNSEIAVARPAN